MTPPTPSDQNEVLGELKKENAAEKKFQAAVDKAFKKWNVKNFSGMPNKWPSKEEIVEYWINFGYCYRNAEVESLNKEIENLKAENKQVKRALHELLGAARDCQVQSYEEQQEAIFELSGSIDFADEILAALRSSKPNEGVE